MKSFFPNPLAAPAVDEPPRFTSPVDVKGRAWRAELEPKFDRFMRRPEVQRTTGLSRSSLYRLIAKGEFPSSIRICTNSVAWLASEVAEWGAQRVAERDSKAMS